jgi:predicted glycosyltransferase involved in capsule biosynthesis
MMSWNSVDFFLFIYHYYHLHENAAEWIRQRSKPSKRP